MTTVNWRDQEELIIANIVESVSQASSCNWTVMQMGFRPPICVLPGSHFLIMITLGSIRLFHFNCLPNRIAESFCKFCEFVNERHMLSMVAF